MRIAATIESIARRAGVVAAGVVAVAGLMTGCASSPERAARDNAPAADPDALLAAALRSWSVENNPEQALRLAAQATAAAPTRAEAVLFHLRLCAETPRCETQPLEVLLKKLAPDNGVVWLSALKRAQTTADEQGEAQILAAMSRAREFNVYWTTLVQRLTTATHNAPPPRTGEQVSAPLATALNEVVARLSALTVPAFSPIPAACTRESAREPERRAVCERIAQALERGDTYIAEGLGLGLAQQFAAPGSASANEIEQRIDALGYRNRTAGAIVAAQVERDKFSAELLELMKKVPREQDVYLAILRWAGQPLTPD
ncbi:MAG TPA: hypothetical protein VHK24_10995 [Steroidobacter sp.]|nr:hypothetical protein [Steroidobacter sp.]